MSSKKAGRRVKQPSYKRAELLGDVTLNDYANSNALGFQRLTKKVTNKLYINVKQMSSVEDDRAWDEKLDDLELIIPKEESDEEDEEEHAEFSSHRTPTGKATTSTVKNDDDCVDYPVDIWYLISEYIHPESVGTFAAICKTSYQVVQSAKFWFDLYKRYYRYVPNLPERLQPECIVRRYGLRAYVIRALYFMYPPFISKIKPQTTFEGDPHLLKKRQCVLSWSQQVKNQWWFNFKMKLCNGIYGIGRKTSSAKPDLIEMLEDISVNVDDNCKVLQVVCLSYSPLPMILGQTLSNVSLNVSQGLRHHRLHLNFCSGPALSYMTNSTIVLDPVINIRVLDWWHPLFPHTDGLHSSSFTPRVTTLDFDDPNF